MLRRSEGGGESPHLSSSGESKRSLTSHRRSSASSSNAETRGRDEQPSPLSADASQNITEGSKNVKEVVLPGALPSLNGQNESMVKETSHSILSRRTSPSQSNLTTPREGTPTALASDSAEKADDITCHTNSVCITTTRGQEVSSARSSHAVADAAPPVGAALTAATEDVPSPSSSTTLQGAKKLVLPSASAAPADSATACNTAAAVKHSPDPASASRPAATPGITAEVAIRKWKENKDYLKLQRELSRVLSAMDRTTLTDWAAQASLLSQLLKTLQSFKDVVGAVELPDGEHFAKSMWRALSPQSVVGVQRKALEVLQTYFGYVNSAYPMPKDLPLLLPALLELLPQATMQVKADILDLLDRGVVHRMPTAALRSSAQGLFVALLSCLEESETSLMYRRALALIEYVHSTLRHEDAVTAAARKMLSTSIYAAELRGGQILPAYAWLLIRDAANVRSPALSVMKVFIARADVHSPPQEQRIRQGSDQYRGDSINEIPSSVPPPVAAFPEQPDWVGGDVDTVVLALLNSLQDTQEKTQRLALDVLMLICPLSGGDGGSCGVDSCSHTVAAAASSYESAAGMPPLRDDSIDVNGAAGESPTSSGCAFSTSARRELFSFEVRSLLVAAAVQILGTRCSTPSVTRRIFQWLTVDSSFSGGDHSCGSLLATGDYTVGSGGADGAVVGGSSLSTNAYVRDVTSYVISQGFHTVVQHWETAVSACTAKPAEGREKAEGSVLSPDGLQHRQVAARLSALHRTAYALMHKAAPRLTSAPSIAAALGGKEGNGKNGFNATDNCIASCATSAAAAVLATPLVWLRALLQLFRYRSPAFASGATTYTGAEVENGLQGSPAASDSSQFHTSDGTAEPNATPLFLSYVAPLVLPSLSRLLVEVPTALARRSLTSLAGSSPEEEMWAAEVRELLRILPWTFFAELDVVTTRAVEKLIRPTLAQLSTDGAVAEAQSATEGIAASSPLPVTGTKGTTDHLQRRVQQYISQLFTLASALEPALIDATAEQPLAAQEYVRVSLEWSDSLAALLAEVLSALATAAAHDRGQSARADDVSSPLSLLISTANGLLRLLVQRMHQLMEPILDSILATATATGSAAIGADFFSSFLRLVDTRVLRQVRQAALHATTSLLPNGYSLDRHSRNDAVQLPPLFCTDRAALPAVYGVEVQKLLWRMHHTTLRFTSFLAQLHLRCQQQAVVGVLLDYASEDGAGARERELARQTSDWLTRLCSAATAAGTDDGATLFFTRAVQLMLDMLLHARGSLLPEQVYHALAPTPPVMGGMAEGVTFSKTYMLTPVVRCLWEACGRCQRAKRDAATDEAAQRLPSLPADTATMCGELLLVLIAVSPACARSLDVCMLQSPVETTVRRLVRLHRQLTEMRAQQRRGRPLTAAISESVALTELQDPGVLFLGLLTILNCLSGSGGGACAPACQSGSGLLDYADDTAGSTRQLARAYLSHVMTRDLPSVLLPLFFSFLCPLVLPSASTVSQRDIGAAGSSRGSSPTPAFSAIPLTVLLPTVQRQCCGSAGEGGVPSNADPASAAAALMADRAVRTYRNLEASELVQHLFSLLQLRSAAEWVCHAMQVPTPNSLRVLLRGLEAQSFMAPEGRAGGSGGASPTSSSTAPAREGPSDTLFAATVLLLLNLSRQSLLSLHWSFMRRCDQSGGALHGRCSSSSSDSPQWAEPSAYLRHQSTLLDSLACLNRLLELSQTGPRTHPHRTAVRAWQFTSAQLLPLLRLAVQADLHTAQGMLLDHLYGAVLYLDDVVRGGTSSLSVTGTQTSMEETFASRHWRHHVLLRVGVAAAGHTDKVLAGAGASTQVPPSTVDICTGYGVGAPGVVGAEMAGAALVLDDLKRTSPGVLSNKLLYAMLGEVAEHVLKNLTTTASDAASCAREVDTLTLWLKFYCSILPYLYCDLVTSVEAVVDVLLAALEPATLQAAYTLLQDVSCPVTMQFLCACYAALTYILRFVFSVARAADVENYEAAVKAKESMSWIASTFSSDDPVAQARNSPMWTRSCVLAPIRVSLSRLVSAAVRCLCLCDAPPSKAATTVATGMSSNSAAWAALSPQNTMWDYDSEEEEDTAMGWNSRPPVDRQPSKRSSAAADLREHARNLLGLLCHTAGPEFLSSFIDNWCHVHAAPTSFWWMFETVPQRQCRLRHQRKWHRRTCSRCMPHTVVHGSGEASEKAQTRRCAWEAKETAQRTAYVLVEDISVSIGDVMAAVGPLLREATSTQQRVEQQRQQQQLKGEEADTASSGSANKIAMPPRVTQLLYFVDQLVEAVCVKRQELRSGGSGGGGVTEQEADVVLATMSDVVSQWPPEPLSFCCVLHTMYCVVAYAKDEAVSTEAEKGTRSTSSRGGGSSSSGAKSAGPSSPSVTAVKVYQNKDFCFALCRLLEGLTLNPAVTHRSAALLLLQLLCETFYAVLPSSLSVMDNPGRVVEAATRLFQRTLLPILRRGIASKSEAEILSSASLVNASLRVLRAAIRGFAPDITFEQRVQRDITALIFSENFFRYSRSALHEWTLLLRQMCAMDHEFHSVLCERLVPSPGRLSTIMMSRETEALLRERAMKNLAFYLYVVMVSDEAVSTSPTAGRITTTTTAVAASAAATVGAGVALSMVRQKELIHLIREQLTYTLQHFSSSIAPPTAVQIEKKEVFVQPLRSAFLVFRVLLMSNARESLVASLWPLVWPELLRALAIVPPGPASAAGAEGDNESAKPTRQIGAEALREILLLQMEALKVLDTDYTLHPAHALAFRWLFTDDAALTSLVALQQQQQHHRSRKSKQSSFHTSSPLAALLHSSVVRRQPLVSHLEVLHLLQETSPVTSSAYLCTSSVVSAVHEPRMSPSHDDDSDLTTSDGLAPVLSTIQQLWPPCARPSASDDGLRRPLYNIPVVHYLRLDGLYRAAQAFTLLVQRVNAEALPCAAASELKDVQCLLSLQAEVAQCVGHHNEVDLAYMQDLVEADLTTTDPDTML
jgi:hypothetical protein